MDGTVLLRANPPVGVVAAVGVAGPWPLFEVRECFDDVDLFLRTFPCLATLSAPALALDEERATPLDDRS